MAFCQRGQMSTSSKNFYRFADQKVYIGAGNVDQKLSGGVYQMKLCRQTGEAYIEQVAVGSKDATSVTGQMQEIVGVTKKFAENVVNNKFKEHTYKSKFGMLLEGPPGTGKSHIVDCCVNEFTKAGGIVIFISDERTYIGGQAGQFFKKLNTIEPNLPLMIILEDLDAIQPHLEVYLTSILDGEQSPLNTLFLGTTNFIERLSPRIRRPGRFDIIYKVDGLSDSLRRKYITGKLKEFNMTSTKEAVKEIYDLTNGYNFSEIRTFMAYLCFFGFDAKNLASKITRLATQTEPDEPIDHDEMYEDDEDEFDP